MFSFYLSKYAIVFTIIISTFFGLFSFIGQASSASILENLGTAAKAPFGLTEQEAASGESDASIGRIIGDIVQVILGFTGTIAFIVFLYGGFLWLTARGNETQVEQAKKYLFNGIVGTVIIILAYSITFFLTDVLFEITQ